MSAIPIKASDHVAAGDIPSLSVIRGTNASAPLLTTKEAARLLGVSKAFLERDRWAGARIPFVKIGSRAVRYELSALHNYIARQCRHSTSERGAS